jgi:hypothetical protein
LGLSGAGVMGWLVVGSGDVNELLPPLGSCGRSGPPFLLAKAFHRLHQELLVVFPSSDSY